MIKIKIKFFLNYKPFIVYSSEDFSFKQIFCRYFFFLLLFFEYYFKKINLNFFLWFFKSKKKINSFLKAPHHYKIAQTKVVKIFYYIIFYLHFIFKLNFYYIHKIMLNLTFFFFLNNSIIHLYNKHFFFKTKVNNFLFF